MGATMVGRLARSFLYYKAFTAARGRTGSPTSQRGARPGPGPTTIGRRRLRRASVWSRIRGPRPWRRRRRRVRRMAAASGEPSQRRRRSFPTRPARALPVLRGHRGRRARLRRHRLGPVRRPLALPVGQSVRRDRQHQTFVDAPPERGKQYGLLPAGRQNHSGRTSRQHPFISGTSSGRRAEARAAVPEPRTSQARHQDQSHCRSRCSSLPRPITSLGRSPEAGHLAPPPKNES